MKHTIFLGLGSNLGNKLNNLRTACNELKSKVKIIKFSSIYETKPFGFNNQQNFINAVVKAETDMLPNELFIFVKKIEKKIGRTKTIKNGPRVIDIDILLYNDEIINCLIGNDALIIPHPSMHIRDTVLVPLCELDNQIIHPVLNISMKQLEENLKDRFIIEKLLKNIMR